MLIFPIINKTSVNYIMPKKQGCRKYELASPSFTSLEGVVKDPDGNLLYKINTELFRMDILWDDFADFVTEKYKNVENVNVICHACSGGYEPYSFLAVLKANHEDEVYKFQPIKARDIDKRCITLAQKGMLELNASEIMFADYCMEGQFSKYFKKVSGDLRAGEIVCPIDELSKNIQFKQSNIMNDINEISKDNTVLMLRNVWPYLDTKDIVNLAKTLAASMKSNSLLVIGAYDQSYGIDELLESFGFKETHILNVYEPPGNSFKTKLRANIIAQKILAKLPKGKLCTVCGKEILKNLSSQSIKLFSTEA